MIAAYYYRWNYVWWNKVRSGIDKKQWREASATRWNLSCNRQTVRFRRPWPETWSGCDGLGARRPSAIVARPRMEGQSVRSGTAYYCTCKVWAEKKANSVSRKERSTRCATCDVASLKWVTGQTNCVTGLQKALLHGVFGPPFEALLDCGEWCGSS